MPDQRRHRGPHPEDRRLFAAERVPELRVAVGHLAWLLERDYALPSALKLVGDRFQLEDRQRLALMRSACTPRQRWQRLARRVEPAQLAGRRVLVDGYNLLTTLEAALAGGVVLVGQDGGYRDLASMHGTYRRVEETRPALELAGQWFVRQSVTAVHWLFDAPVSNSGRLKQLVEALGRERGWPWSAELAANPDGLLIESEDVIATADSAVLDRCRQWTPVAAAIVSEEIPTAWVLDLRDA